MSVPQHRKPSFIANLMLAIIVAGWLLPTLSLLISSLRSSDATLSSGWWSSLFRYDQLTLANYRYVISQSGIGRAFINSILISVPATFFTIFFSALAAFPIAFFKFPGKRLSYALLVGLQIIPIQITLVPVLAGFNKTGLAGTYPAVWIAHTAYGLPFSIFVIRSFFSQLPGALIEAAQLDGARPRRIFLSIVLPLSKPVIASLAIFQFLWVWNDLLVALVYLGGDPSVAPLTVRIASMNGSLESGWHTMAPAAFLSMLLPLAVFLALQKYFVRGVLAGAVKG